jgi:2-dehydropantoate 2-reductase
MRVVVYGAGAIGGVIGARLHQSGQEVVLIARGAHHDAIKAKGLTLESPDEVVTLAIDVVDHPDRLRFAAGDVVLLCMKGQDTAAAVRALASSAPPETPVVCVMNGADNERSVLRSFENTYGICVMCPTTHLEPGVVQANSTPVSGILDVGRYPAGVDATARSLASALAASTFVSEARDDIMRWKYRKLLMNLGNAVEAVCGPAARGGEIMQATLTEGEAVLAAAGIACATAEEDAARRGDILKLRPIGGQRRGGGSSWQSLTRRTGTIESDYLNGEIVLLGRISGVPTPVNTKLQRLANQFAHTGMSPGSMSEAEFWAAP